jgi:hypothetical protein
MLFRQTLLPALEEWRKFELATVLECAAALAAQCGTRAVLDASFSPKRPAARVGRFHLWWQRVVPPRAIGALDVGEALSRQLAATLGVDAGAGRADVAIEVDGIAVAFVECKWFGYQDSAPAAILEACSQLVGYARDEVDKSGGDAALLLSRSLVALAIRGNAPLADGSGGIACADLHDMEAGRLDAWAARVASAVSL